jgi:hypothetical protein
MNTLFNDYPQQCDCGNTEFNVILLGTSCTPPDIKTVCLRCLKCNNIKEIEVYDKRRSE